MTDPVDAIMEVMRAAFDPAFGEAWTRRQVADALVFANTRYLLAGSEGISDGEAPESPQGFTLSRQAADEEELLLIAVHPLCRHRGVASRLLHELCEQARSRGVSQMFLEMRDGNEARYLYESFGFEQIGRRKGYYRSDGPSPIDALTFSKKL